MKKQKTLLISLGGTILSEASKSLSEFYSTPSLNIEQVVVNAPHINEKVELKIIKLAQIISNEMTDELLISLAQLLNSELRNDEISGAIVIAGTNTIEEVAYFANLIVKSNKPIVFTGAINPNGSSCYDGYVNLSDAVIYAISEKAKNNGVVLCFNHGIFTSRDVYKCNPSSINAFDSGQIGRIQGEEFYLDLLPVKRHTTESEFHSNFRRFPPVVILYGHLSMDEFFITAAINNEIAGIVSAGFGNGYQSSIIQEKLAEAVKRGIVVVRCPRFRGQANFDEHTDGKYGFIPGNTLQPAKARMLLATALANGCKKDELYRVFREY